MAVAAGLDAWLEPAAVTNASVIAQAVPRAVSLSPTSGPRGTVVRIDGQGFKEGTTVTVWRDADDNRSIGDSEPALATATVNSGGAFTATFAIDGPSFVPGARNPVNAIDGLTGSAREPAYFTLEGNLTVSPDHGYGGDAFEVTLLDFFPNTLVLPGSVTLGGVRVHIPGDAVPTLSPKTDSRGNGSFVTTVPFGTPAGLQTLAVDINCPCGVQTSAFNVLIPSLTISPSEAVAFQRLVLRGANFTPANLPGGLGPHGVHQIEGNEKSGITLNGATLTVFPFDLDSDGMFYAEITLPLNSTTETPGERLTFKVTDSRGRTGSATVTIKQRTLSVDPKTSPQGSKITVTGEGFVAVNAKINNYMPVDIDYAGTLVATVIPDSLGSFKTSFNVPLRTAASSSYPIKATTRTFSWSAAVIHSIPATSMTISPTEGPPGTRVTVTGVSFPGFTPLSGLTISGRQVLPSPVPATDAGGGFTTFITVPQLDTGDHPVAVTARGLSSQVYFRVTNQALPQAPRSEAAPSLTSSQPSIAAMPALATPSPSPPGTALAQLGENLLRVWHFDETDAEWKLYDRRPVFSGANSLRELGAGKLYFVRVAAEQGATLNGRERLVFAGWNLLHW